MTESGNGGLEISSLLNGPHLKFSNALKHFQEIETNEDRPEGGRPKNANDAVHQEKVPSRIERKSRANINSNRKMARTIGVSRESVRMILREAGLEAHKKVKGHLITEQAKVKW
ncbi:hypothetical protein Y032_0012g1864 [Ancylostoma ceylanicum]|uniref:Uncharacterized protein n=1 Tax=Ancylostoma ceylanicum TaxID=53326 RepID=A0A016VDP8_9BILA|nr:hypothetical protein Y032_0012g1864 [Ancylostoma ceylanicum]